MDEKEAFFKARITTFERQTSEVAGKLREWSTYRIGIFVVSIIALVYFANERMAWPVFFVLVGFFLIFGSLVNVYNKTKKNLSFLKSMLAVNQDEVRRQQLDIKHLSDGKEFLSENHPYVADLDIFGRHSIFQLVNRGSTPPGTATLASWLSFPAKANVVSPRQQAVRELESQIEWRQSFEAFGRMNLPDKSKPVVPLEQLLSKPAPISQGFKIWAAASMAVSLVIYGLAILSVVVWQWVFLAAILNSFFLVALMKSMNEEYQKMQGLSKQLSVYVDLFNCIETGKFENSLLHDHQSILLNPGPSASVAFKKLHEVVNRFDSRINMLYQILNSFLLLDFWLITLAQKWFDENIDHVGGWMEALGEMEAISSLAGFAFANPAYVYPETSGWDFDLKASQLGHPLIPAKKRVVNDFVLDGKGLILITGSNMSGKSTFLRTVGVNSVLALAGAPVCANSMTISYMELFTSMRTHDDLSESVSSFYAELKRLRQLLDLLETGAPVLYMLDEVLKGTNSEDRHIGTKALVRQLLREKAAGFISTHDLSLSELGNTDPLVTNFSFNSLVKGDELLFDYKLTEGPCKSFNASQLMKNIGIEIIP
ncbi:DNA mismatch repair protein MutS [Imperialibacter roseus]|uniref:DNA mismatch repair protein MutS n=1 Tax=Imperialibacter roseus TaxID=1324217 RepID=A0ABZ0IQ09_9BACT|nr:DNA mismatch repair protein MutS [Imperialibacter roseus]WOK06534.1 DNA mismatch repair protein MutS [Imperialibacter roseus]